MLQMTILSKNGSIVYGNSHPGEIGLKGCHLSSCLKKTYPGAARPWAAVTIALAFLVGE